MGKSDGWSGEVIRLEYDREAAQMVVVTSGFWMKVAPLPNSSLLNIASRPDDQLARLYSEEYYGTDISMEDSVDKMLQALNL